MRILLTLNDISVTGGVERVVCNLANAFCEMGHEVLVFSFENSNNCDFSGESLPFDFNKNVQIHFSKCDLISLKKPKNAFRKILREFLRLFVQVLNRALHIRANQILSSLINDFKPDIVLSNDFNKISKTTLKAHKKIPIFKVIHGMFEIYRNDNLQDFKNAILLSHLEKQTFQEHFPHCNFYVIPNFMPKIQIHNVNYAQKVIISAGRITEEKGFDRLIEVYKILSLDANFYEIFKEWRLVIVGSGNRKEKIKEKIKEYNLGDFITLKPFTRGIEKEYERASIYAMTSRTEGFGMVLVEANSFGIPCVAFDIIGPKAVIEDGKSGFLIPDGDLQIYADKLKLLMQNENLREKMGKEAKRIAQEKFSKEVVLKQWTELFENLTNVKK